MKGFLLYAFTLYFHSSCCAGVVNPVMSSGSLTSWRAQEVRPLVGAPPRKGPEMKRPCLTKASGPQASFSLFLDGMDHRDPALSGW